MQSLRGILNFTRTAELGSFAKAAQELGISAVAVSQNISRLEQALGVRLLARSTRALTLTPEGLAFLEQCKEPLAQLQTACQEAATSAQTASGHLRASVVSPVAFLYLVPLLPKLMARHPELTLELELSEDTSPLIAKKFDVGVRVGALQDAAYVARPLGPLRMHMCASPAYLALHGSPANLEAAQAHAWVTLQLAQLERPAPLYVQVRDGAARSLRTINVRPKLTTNDYRTVLAACEAGLGLAQLPQPLALAALQAGRLQAVLPDHAPEGLQLFIHYPSRKQLPARVRAFVDFCIEHFAGHPDLTQDVQSGLGQAEVRARN